MKISLLTFTSALLVGIASAQQQQVADDSPSYFGGINNEEYLNWLATNDIETRYQSSVYIPSIDQGLGAAIHWSTDDEYLHVAVAARASGWVGFGLSDVGGMLGSDFALFSLSRPNEIVDAHAVEDYFPKEDDCQRDWIYVNSSYPSSVIGMDSTVSISRGESMALEQEQEDSSATARTTSSSSSSLSEEFIMFEARRKLVTNDPQDLPIVRDDIIAVPEQRIIAAWGDSPDVSFHGRSNVARGSVRIYKNHRDGGVTVEQDGEVFEGKAVDADNDPFDFESTMNKHSDGSFFVGAIDYELTSVNDTTYADFCVTRNDLIAMGVPNTTDLMSVIGMKPIIQKENAAYVHHYIVTAKFDASDETCGEGPGFDMLWAWAPGDGGFALPEFLGANLFGENGFQAFNVEIHYDNPTFKEGIVDNSGVEIFYTKTPRPIEMGIIQTGDPFVGLNGVPVGAGLSGHHFECPGSCSDTFLSDGEPVTVFREYLHMHIHGTRTTNEHIRNGTVIRTAATEVWEFDQNGNVPVRQQPYEVHPGDSFRTSCFYRGQKDSIFGLSSREEMCIAFLYYYPRKSIHIETTNYTLDLPWMCSPGFDILDNACNAAYDPQGEMLDEEAMHRNFGKQPEQCLISADGAAASASDPAIILDPSSESNLRPAPVPAPATEPAPAPVEPVKTETTTSSSSASSLRPEAPVPVPAPVEPVRTETTTASSESNLRPAPVPAPLHQDEFANPMDEPSTLRSTSSATSMLTGAALYLALILAAVM